MGFYLSGVVLNKNFQNNFEELQTELGWKLKKGEEIDFETASENDKEEEFCDVYYTENGTILFVEMDMCTQPYPIVGCNTMAFAMADSSGAYNLDYCENGVVKRSIMEVDGNRVQDTGNALTVEEKSSDVSEIIWNQMETMIGKRFWDIEPEEKANRYMFDFSKEPEPIIPVQKQVEEKKSEEKVLETIQETRNEHHQPHEIPTKKASESYSREQYLEICCQCKNRGFHRDHGVICVLTQKIADFDGQCNHFQFDTTIKKTDSNSVELLKDSEKNRRAYRNIIIGSLLLFLGIFLSLSGARVFIGLIIGGGLMIIGGIANMGDS